MSAHGSHLKWNSGNKEAAQKLDGKDARQFCFWGIM
jgi:hypothetical protein